MSPDRYAVSSSGNRRLSGFVQQRGSRMGMPTWGGFLFGACFVAVGTAVILVGMKVLPADSRSVHAPYWVLTAVGASFALGGLTVWGMAWKQSAANRQRIQAARLYPNEPALADYPWHPGGFEVSEWPGVAKAAALAIGLTIFLSVFNWWAFIEHGPWLVKAIVILFDCMGLALWWQAGRQLGRALKFGQSRIVFTRFPYLVSEPVIVRWQPSDGISEVRKGTFTLRCVVEWMESSGTGRNRNAYLVHEEIWSGQWLFDHPHKLGPKDAVELRYELPPHAQPAQLTADKPVFWELEVKLDLPGLNFQETYLVPIYSPKTTPRIQPIPVKS